jgi:hypothetical protein
VIRVARDRHRRISALAEELDIPVAIHLGENFGAPYRDDPEYGAHWAALFWKRGWFVIPRRGCT